MRGDDVPPRVARAVLGDGVPVGHEDEDVAKVLRAGILGTAGGAEVDGARDGQRHHDAHAGAMGGLARVRHQDGGRRGEAVVVVDDVHVERVDLVPDRRRGCWSR